MRLRRAGSLRDYALDDVSGHSQFGEWRKLAQRGGRSFIRCGRTKIRLLKAMNLSSLFRPRRVNDVFESRAEMEHLPQ